METFILYAVSIVGACTITSRIFRFIEWVER